MDIFLLYRFVLPRSNRKNFLPIVIPCYKERMSLLDISLPLEFRKCAHYRSIKRGSLLLLLLLLSPGDCKAIEAKHYEVTVPKSEHTLSLMDVPHTADDKIERLLNSRHSSSPPDAEKPLRDPIVADSKSANTEVTYPEGGLDAWLVVLGAWCGLTASLGIYNTSGVFDAVISNVLLPEESPSTIGWIFSVYAFVNWACGVQVGPTFDAIGPRALIIAGTVCTLVGIFALSVCKGELGSHVLLYPSSIPITLCSPDHRKALSPY